MIGLVALLAVAHAEPDARLVEIRQLFDDLACDKLIPLADAVAADAATSKADGQEARFRQGYCLVVVGRTSAAADVFSAIFKDDVDAKPSFPLDTKVQVLVDGARAGEVNRRSEAKDAQRKTLRESVVLAVHPPLNLVGGHRATFTVDVTAPPGTVKTMRIDFIKGKGREPYGLPLLKRPGGSATQTTWVGEIPGLFTRSSQDTQIRYFITAADNDGALATAGDRAKPLLVDVAAGSEVALDLKASERLSRPARLIYALIGVPAITSTFFIGVTAASLFADRYLFANDVPKSAQGLARLTGTIVSALAPPLAADAGAAVATQFLLDGDEAYIAPGIVAGATSLWFLGVAIGNYPLILNARVAIFGGATPAKLPTTDAERAQLSDDAGRSGIGFLLCGAGAALGLAAALLGPSIMVGVDNARDALNPDDDDVE